MAKTDTKVKKQVLTNILVPLQSDGKKRKEWTVFQRDRKMDGYILL